MLPTGTIIIEGEASGADTLARQVGENLGFDVWQFPADWKLHGKSAGPIRNRRMVLEGKPDLVIAFHTNLKKSKGTADMVAYARSKGIKVEVVTA